MGGSSSSVEEYYGEVSNPDVAATDLFPFANQCPRQEIRSLTDRSTGRAH